MLNTENSILGFRILFYGCIHRQASVVLMMRGTEEGRRGSEGEL